METAAKKITILHIDTGLDWRGGQRQSLELHKRLLKQNINSIMAVNKDGEQLKFAKENNIDNIYGFSFKGELSKFSANELLRIFHKIKPNIVHCHDSHSVSLSKQFKKRSLICHTRRVSYPIGIFSRFFKYKYINCHFGVSEEISNYLRQYFEKVVTINSCVDTKRFENITLQSPLQNSKRVKLIFVGAFSAQKGLDILIYAFSKIRKEFEDISLHLVGDGPLLYDIKKLCTKLNINNCVHFYGSQRKVEPYYLASDIVISPSVNGEGSNGVIKEAMAAKKVIVASDIEANKELIEDKKNGFLFKSGDVESLTHTLKNILSRKIILKKEIVASNAEKFCCNKMTSSYINSYYHLLEKYGS